LDTILGWPGYTVYRQEIDEKAKTLKLWVRRKRGNRKLICSGCGARIAEPAEVTEREVRDLPCFEYRTTVVIELYRVRCPNYGLKIEKVDQLPSKAPFSKRFEEAVGEGARVLRRGAWPNSSGWPKVRSAPLTCATWNVGMRNASSPPQTHGRG
jgi:hypothetical protein